MPGPSALLPRLNIKRSGPRGENLYEKATLVRARSHLSRQVTLFDGMMVMLASKPVVEIALPVRTLAPGRRSTLCVEVGLQSSASSSSHVSHVLQGWGKTYERFEYSLSI